MAKKTTREKPVAPADEKDEPVSTTATKSKPWPVHFRSAALVLLFVVLLLLTVPLLWAAIQWWILGTDTDAMHTVMPFRYLLEHPPSATLAAFIGALLFLFAFWQPIERILENLRKGPLGIETHRPREREKGPLPKKSVRDRDRPEEKGGPHAD